MARPNALGGDSPLKARLGKSDATGAGHGLQPQFDSHFDGSGDPEALIALFRDPSFSAGMAQAIFDRLAPRVEGQNANHASGGERNLQTLRELHLRINAGTGGMGLERKTELYGAMAQKLTGEQMASFALATNRGTDAMAIAQVMGHLPFDREFTAKKIDFAVAIVQAPQETSPDAPAIAAEHVLANSAVLRDAVVFNGVVDGLTLDGTLDRVIGTHFKSPHPGSGSCDELALSQIVEAAQRIGNHGNWQAISDAVAHHYEQIGQPVPEAFTQKRSVFSEPPGPFLNSA